eukprot:9883919-Lingulodinium_polyedra.AAC.1
MRRRASSGPTFGAEIQDRGTAVPSGRQTPSRPGRGAHRHDAGTRQPRPPRRPRLRAAPA